MLKKIFINRPGLPYLVNKINNYGSAICQLLIIIPFILKNKNELV